MILLRGVVHRTLTAMGVKSLMSRAPGIVRDRVRSAHLGWPRRRTWRLPVRGGPRNRTSRRPVGRRFALRGLFTTTEADGGKPLQQAHSTLLGMLAGRPLTLLSPKLVLGGDQS
jgi:hypothetical protein